MNLDRAVFFLPHTQFIVVVIENRAIQTAYSLAVNNTPFFPQTRRVLRGRMGVVLHTTLILPKASPLDSKRAFGASLLTLSKRQERQMEKRKTTNRFQRRRTLRLAAEEDERITRQAVTAGISVSEYMRRLFFGGSPSSTRPGTRTAPIDVPHSPHWPRMAYPC